MSPSGTAALFRQGLGQLLAAESVVTWDEAGYYPTAPTLPPCYDTSYPDKVGARELDVAVALSTYYTGGDGKAGDVTSWLQLQVRTRGRREGPSTDADDLDDAIAQVLLGRPRFALPNVVIVSHIERSSSTPLGRDAAGRFERTTNWAVRVSEPAPYRVS